MLVAGRPEKSLAAQRDLEIGPRCEGIAALAAYLPSSQYRCAGAPEMTGYK